MSCKVWRFVASFVSYLALLSLLAACAPPSVPPPTTAPKPAATAPAAPTTAPAPKPGPVGTPPAPTTAPAPKPAPTAAQPAAKPGPAGPPSGEWVIAITEETPSLDPAWYSALPAQSMSINLFDPLVRVEGLDRKIVPMLAESWSRTDDRTWLFKLRKGVKYHNGDDFTSADVKYSLDLFKSDKSQNKTYLAEVTSVEPVDPTTLKITTVGPNPSLLVNLAQLFIMPRQAREKAGEDAFARNPVGTGPYKFVEFVRGQRLVVEANPNYWRGTVSPKRLVFRPILDPSTRVAELKTGGVQIIQGPPPARFKEIDSGDTQLMALKSGRVIIHPFNTKDKPLDDVRVRRAVNQAIDRDAIIKNVLEGYGVPLHGPFSPGWLGYDPDLKPYPYDPAKAKQLLAEAGYPNGFEMTFNISQGAFLRDREIAEVVASQLAQVGVKVQLVPTDRAKLISDWHAGVFKGVTSTAWTTSADPDPMFGFAFYKRPGHKPDEKLNSLVEQSRRTLDPAERERVARALGQYVHEQAYWLFIHAQDEFYAKRQQIPWILFPHGASFSVMRYYRASWE